MSIPAGEKRILGTVSAYTPLGRVLLLWSKPLGPQMRPSRNGMPRFSLSPTNSEFFTSCLEPSSSGKVPPLHTHANKQCKRNTQINAAPTVHAHQVPEPRASHPWITFTTAQSPRFPQCIIRSLPYMAFSNYSPSTVAWAAFGKHKGIHFIMIAKCVWGAREEKKRTISSLTWRE